MIEVWRQIVGLWRRDHTLLWPLSGVFVFLPQFALLLLVPEIPPSAPGMTIEAWGEAIEPWVADCGAWYLAAYLVAQYGALAVMSLYARPQRDLRGAMARAARLYPRSLLATALVTVPCGMLAVIAVQVPALPLIAVPAILYVLVRTVLIGPVIVGEPGIGAAAAVVRSWRLTSGQALTVALVVAAVLVAGQVAGGLAGALDRAVRDGAFANVVLVAMVEAVAAGIAWATGLALALAQVALYRRLAR